VALKPVARASSLRERAAVAIRAGIITGEIEEGKIYSAPALAQTLNVSATPVREAMLDLVNEGLVQTVRNKGFRVIPLTERDLDEIFEIRVYLEVPAVAELAGRAHLLGDETFAHLQSFIEDLEASAEAEDVASLIEGDRRFHRELLVLAGNGRLAELVDRMRSYTRRYGYRQLDKATLLRVAADHWRILDALATGDKDLTREVMQDHLAANRGILAGGRSPSAPLA